MIEPIRKYDAIQLQRISEITIGYYDRMAKPYWDGARDHDVSQNHAALLEEIEGEPPFCIVDLGCGPGVGGVSTAAPDPDCVKTPATPDVGVNLSKFPEVRIFKPLI